MHFHVCIKLQSCYALGQSKLFRIIHQNSAISMSLICWINDQVLNIDYFSFVVADQYDCSHYLVVVIFQNERWACPDYFIVVTGHWSGRFANSVDVFWIRTVDHFLYSRYISSCCLSYMSISSSRRHSVCLFVRDSRWRDETKPLNVDTLVLELELKVSPGL